MAPDSTKRAVMRAPSSASCGCLEAVAVAGYPREGSTTIA
jgi:hypothetical protein